MNDSAMWTACSKEILKRAAPKLDELGFRRTKPAFFTKLREHWCEFIHVHKFSGRRHYRLHAGIRVYNSVFPACALNGPCTLPGDRRFFLGFVNHQDSWERCSGEFPKFAMLVALPWLTSFSTSASLIALGSPLQWEEQQALQDALAGNGSSNNIALSKRLLGLK